jgi:hypothetical protein
MDTSYIRLDYPDVLFDSVNSTYFNVISSTNDWYGYLGMDSSNSNGFIGDVREFMVFKTFVPFGQVPNIKNSVLLFDLNMIAYFRLKKGNLFDEYRYV